MAAQTVDKLGVGSYAQHHFSLIINSFFIFLKKAKNPAVFHIFFPHMTCNQLYMIFAFSTL